MRIDFFLFLVDGRQGRQFAVLEVLEERISAGRDMVDLVDEVELFDRLAAFAAADDRGGIGFGQGADDRFAAVSERLLFELAAGLFQTTVPASRMAVS